MLPDERARMAIPTVGRSRDELLAPFAAGPLDGLALRRTEVFAAEDRIWETFHADGDAAAFGARWTAFCRASVFPTLAAAIADPARRAAFFERTAADLVERLAAAPAPANVPLARIEFAKAAALTPAPRHRVLGSPTDHRGRSPCPPIRSRRSSTL